ncbi:MAG TPA: ferredoxin--NADP reductase [Acidimicrobiales bacterium]|nr:ferredoxin--NADP reductase [Acidimicrobiales bacterium]
MSDVTWPAAVRERYNALRVKRILTETDHAKSIVFDVPPALAAAYRYTAGQFVTLRVLIDDEAHLRSYSMSSAPGIDDELQVTVKRVPDGLVSNFVNDKVDAGDVLDVSTPTGSFVLDASADDVVLFAAGSGITPVFSLVKTALHTTARAVRLLYANRDRSAAIFGDALDGLAAQFGERFRVVHHEDAATGFVQTDEVLRMAGDGAATFYVCGPAPFMDIVESTLLGRGVDKQRIHIERFTPAADEPIDEPVPETAAGETVVITLGNRTETVAQRGKSTILQSARWAGLKAPSSCEAGHCATCMAQVVEGGVEMANNEVLTAEEVADGWVLTCQSVPVTPLVKVVFE